MPLVDHIQGPTLHAMALIDHGTATPPQAIQILNDLPNGSLHRRDPANRFPSIALETSSQARSGTCGGTIRFQRALCLPESRRDRTGKTGDLDTRRANSANTVSGNIHSSRCRSRNHPPGTIVVRLARFCLCTRAIHQMGGWFSAGNSPWPPPPSRALHRYSAD